MALRSKLVLKIHDKLASAASVGMGVRKSDIRRMLPATRIPECVIWELRRHGAKTVAIKDGKHLIGWKLEKPLKADPVRLAEPTVQRKMKFKPELFPAKTSKIKSALSPPVEAEVEVEVATSSST